MSFHLGRGVEGIWEGEANVMTSGTWSEPMEEREMVSQLPKARKMCGLANDRSITVTGLLLFR